MINKRFTCLSYGMPILYFAYRLFLAAGNDLSILRLPYKEMIVLIGILHMIEGTLTLADAKGGSACIVAYKRNKLVGGYQTYKKWVIPLFLFCVKGVYIPIAAVLVYADKTFTMRPGEKAKMMGWQILIYGVIVTLLGYLSIKMVCPLAVVMFCMLGLHEGLFLISRIIEKGEFIYDCPKQGVRVIEVNEAKQDKKLFNRGDIILGINHQKINGIDEYYQILKNIKTRLYIQIRTLEGEKKYIVCSVKDIEEVGLVLLPEE